MMNRIFINIILLILVCFNAVRAQEIDKPSIKVGVYFTGKAEQEFQNGSFRAELENQKNELATILSNSSLSDGYEFVFTATSKFNNYVEPKHRRTAGSDNTSYDEYATFSFEGTYIVLDELINHQLLEREFSNRAISTFDNPSNEYQDIIDLDELGKRYNVLSPHIAPDIVVLIVDEEGESIMADDRILEFQGGINSFDETLYAIVTRDELERNNLALATAIFSILCNSEKATATTIGENISGSLLSYWEANDAITINAGLSTDNIAIFKESVGKIKLKSKDSFIFNQNVDLTNTFNIIDAEEHGIIEPETEQSASILSAHEEELPQNSAMIFTAGVFQKEAPVSYSNGAEIPEAPDVANRNGDLTYASRNSPLILPLEISNLDDGSEIIDDYQIETKVRDDPADNTRKVFRTTKLVGYGNHAKVRVGGESGIQDLVFRSDRLKMALRVYAPAADIEVRLEVSDEYNVKRAVAKATTTKSNDWEWLVFDFDPSRKAGIQDIIFKNEDGTDFKYHHAAIYFNFCNETATNQVFYWEKLKFTEPLSLPILFDQAQDYYELKESANTTTTVYNSVTKPYALTKTNKADNLNIEVATVSGIIIPFEEGQDNRIRMRVIPPGKNRKVKLGIRDEMVSGWKKQQ